MRNKSTRGKFSYRLLKKINAVNNEEELSNGVVLSIKICKTFYIIICKCRFSAPLSMPNNTTFNPGRKFLTQGKCREQLLVAHNMLFKLFYLRSIRKLYRFLNIRKRISKYKKKTPTRQHRSDDSVGGR